MNVRHLVTVITIAWMVHHASPCTAQPADLNDRDSVYRLQPSKDGNQLVAVPPEEIRAGVAYNYYNRRLSRRVWGLARKDHTMQYAFGEGTLLPVSRLDLRLSPDDESQLLDRVAPGLRQQLAVTGGSPAVQMKPDGTWKLFPIRTSARIYDVETGHRWEWHGGRRLAVLHTWGDRWQLVDGRFVPASGGGLWIPSGCGPQIRAGSAVLVERTPELR